MVGIFTSRFDSYVHSYLLLIMVDTGVFNNSAHLFCTYTIFVTTLLYMKFVTISMKCITIHALGIHDNDTMEMFFMIV